MLCYGNPSKLIQQENEVIDTNIAKEGTELPVFNNDTIVYPKNPKPSDFFKVTRIDKILCKVA